MGYDVVATVEKFDLSDMRKRSREGRLDLRDGWAGRWAPGAALKLAGINPYETVVRYGPMLLPGEDELRRMQDYHAPDSVIEFLEHVPNEYDKLDVAEARGNLLITNGVGKLLSLGVAQNAQQAWDATHTRVAVGDGATAATAADTTLTGSTNIWGQVIDSAATVTTTSNQWKVTATHPTGQSNFAWNSWGIDSGTTSTAAVVAQLFNHAVVALGTKTSAAAWAFSVTITIS